MVRQPLLQLATAATMGGLSWLVTAAAIGQVLPPVPTPDAAPAATTPPALPTPPATSDATKAASETSKSLAEPAKTTVDNAGKAAADTTKAARVSTKSATDPARDATRDTRDQARDATREPTRAARDTIQDTRDPARDATRDTRDPARDATRETREPLQDTRDSARDAVRDTRQDARDTARDARDEFRDTRDSTRQQLDDRRDTDRRDTDRRDADRDGRDRAADVDFRADNVRAADFGLWFSRSTANGLVIADIGSNSVITRFGFRAGDRIISVNGQRLTTERQFIDFLFDPQFRNRRVEVIVFRGGAQTVLYVEPAVLIQDYTTVTVDPLEEYGIVLDDRYPNHVVVWKVLPRSAAFYAGIRPGDMIVVWSGRRVGHPREFATLVQQGGARGAIDIQVSRNRQLRDLQLEMGARTALRPNLDVDARGNVDVDRVLPGREERIEDRIERRDDRRDLRSDGTYGAIEGAATAPLLPDVQAGADVQLQPATGGVRVQTTPYRGGLFRRRGR
jgi:hypothetical protein